RNNQTALAHPERGHQVHDSRRVTIGDGLEFDPLVRINSRELLERSQALILRRIFAIDREQLDQLRPAIAAAGFTVNPHPVTQGEAADDFRRDKNILRRLDEVAFRVAQKTETLAGNLDDAFAELG